MISLSQAGEDLKKDRRYLRGLIDGLKIRTHEIGPAVLITEGDFRRLRDEMPRRKPRRRPRRIEGPRKVYG